jgi:hypothetical protein
MNRFKFLVPLIGLLPFLWGFTINGAAPGSSASMTAVAVGTSTPVAVATCSAPTACKRTAIQFDNISTANCYGAPAAQASPCAAASPAPNASTKAGKWLGPNSSWIFKYDPNGNTQGQWQVCAEWDWVCDGSASMSHIDLP